MMNHSEHSVIMAVLEKIASKYLGAQLIVGSDSLTVGASGPKGFDVSVMVCDRVIHLAFNAWEHDTDDSEVAVRLFEDALNGGARLRIDTLSDLEWQWTVERLDKLGRWTTFSTVGCFRFPFWRTAGVKYLRNTFARRSL